MVYRLRELNLAIGLGLLAVSGCQTATKHAAVETVAQPNSQIRGRPTRPSESEEPFVATTHRTHPWVRDPRSPASSASWAREFSSTGSC